MGIRVTDNFDLRAKKPLDLRMSYADIAAMKDASDKHNRAGLYDGLIAWCAAEHQMYMFDSNNIDDETLGRWRLFSDSIPSIPESKIDEVVK